MIKIFDKLWLLPLGLAIVVVFAYAMVSMGLFPLPYYLAMLIPYFMLANLGLIIYIAFWQRNQLLKVLLVSHISLGLAYIWTIQSA